MKDIPTSGSGERPSQAHLEHLLSLFKQTITNVMLQNKVGNFVDIEATYNHFISHHRDEIQALDLSDEQKFIQDLSLMFMQSLGMELGLDNDLSLDNPTTSELTDNDFGFDQPDCADIGLSPASGTVLEESNPLSDLVEDNQVNLEPASSGVSEDNTNNIVEPGTMDNVTPVVDPSVEAQTDQDTIVPVIIPTANPDPDVLPEFHHVKPPRGSHWMIRQYRGSLFDVNNNDNQKINTKTLNWFGKLRYSLYKFTSISANSGRFSASLVCAMIYNIVILGMALSSLTPIIATIAHIGWQENDIALRNYYINKYALYMFAFAWCLIFDWIIRLMYADFSNPYVSTKKAFYSYLLSISNLYQLTSVIAVIAILFVYGKNWAHIADTNTSTKQIATILFLLNVLVVIPRFAENFFFGKNLILLKKIMKSKWKVVLGAILALIVLLLIFSFTMYETESDYYIAQGWLNPQTGAYDMSAFTHGQPFQSIWEALWYSFVTITTIGYGDFVPYSPSGKIIAAVLAVVGISYFTFIMGILVNIFTEYTSARKNDENRLKEIQEKNNKLKQYNYLHQLIVNDFVKAGLLNADKVAKMKSLEEQHLMRASDILDEVEINNRGNLVWNNRQLGIRIYNNKEIKNAEQLTFKPVDIPNKDDQSKLIYSFDDQYLRRILRYKHFSVLITKIVGTTDIQDIFVCKEHFNRDVYACLKVATSVIMSKQLAFDAYVTFSQFDGKLQFDSCFKDDEYVQVTLVAKIIPFAKLNRLSQYGLGIRDFTNYKFLTEVKPTTTTSSTN